MNHTKLKGLLLIALMAVSGLAGCLGSEEDETTDATDAAEAMDAEDGGYTYASNVDNHRSPGNANFGGFDPGYLFLRAMNLLRLVKLKPRRE